QQRQPGHLASRVFTPKRRSARERLVVPKPCQALGGRVRAGVFGPVAVRSLLARAEVSMSSATLLGWARRHALLGLACAAVVLVTGCGDGRVRVQGTVLFEGKPLEEGFVSLEPADGAGPTTG